MGLGRGVYIANAPLTGKKAHSPQQSTPIESGSPQNTPIARGLTTPPPHKLPSPADSANPLTPKGGPDPPPPTHTLQEGGGQANKPGRWQHHGVRGGGAEVFPAERLAAALGGVAEGVIEDEGISALSICTVSSKARGRRGRGGGDEQGIQQPSFSQFSKYCVLTCSSVCICVHACARVCIVCLCACVCV